MGPQCHFGAAVVAASQGADWLYVLTAGAVEVWTPYRPSASAPFTSAHEPPQRVAVLPLAGMAGDVHFAPGQVVATRSGCALCPRRLLSGDTGACAAALLRPDWFVLPDCDFEMRQAAPRAGEPQPPSPSRATDGHEEGSWAGRSTDGGAGDVEAAWSPRGVLLLRLLPLPALALGLQPVRVLAPSVRACLHA